MSKILSINFFAAKIFTAKCLIKLKLTNLNQGEGENEQNRINGRHFALSLIHQLHFRSLNLKEITFFN